MNVVSGPPEAPLPRNVGLLFFNKDPGHFFPATQIDVVYLPEGPGGDQFEEKVFMGPIPQITRDAISYIGRNYLKETVISTRTVQKRSDCGTSRWRPSKRPWSTRFIIDPTRSVSLSKCASPAKIWWS